MVSIGKSCADQASRADVRRQKLIETARRLFIENGFHATGIAQIARQSGIAVGQIYRDFSSKEDIVMALVAEDCGRFMAADALDAAICAGKSEQVVAWLHHFVEPDDDLEGGRLFAEIVAESSRNGRIAEIFTTVQDELRCNLLSALDLLAPGEQLAARREVMADAILTFALGMLLHRLMRPKLDVAPLVEALQAVITDQVGFLDPDGTQPNRTANCKDRGGAK